MKKYEMKIRWDFRNQKREGIKYTCPECGKELDKVDVCRQDHRWFSVSLKGKELGDDAGVSWIVNSNQDMEPSIEYHLFCPEEGCGGMLTIQGGIEISDPDAPYPHWDTDEELALYEYIYSYEGLIEEAVLQDQEEHIAEITELGCRPVSVDENGEFFIYRIKEDQGDE